MEQIILNPENELKDRNEFSFVTLRMSYNATCKALAEIKEGRGTMTSVREGLYFGFELARFSAVCEQRYAMAYLVNHEKDKQHIDSYLLATQQLWGTGNITSLRIPPRHSTGTDLTRYDHALMRRRDHYFAKTRIPERGDDKHPAIQLAVTALTPPKHKNETRFLLDPVVSQGFTMTDPLEPGRGLDDTTYMIQLMIAGDFAGIRRLIDERKSEYLDSLLATFPAQDNKSIVCSADTAGEPQDILDIIDRALTSKG